MDDDAFQALITQVNAVVTGRVATSAQVDEVLQIARDLYAALIRERAFRKTLQTNLARVTRLERRHGHHHEPAILYYHLRK
jgi:hypothetical protein